LFPASGNISKIVKDKDYINYYRSLINNNFLMKKSQMLY